MIQGINSTSTNLDSAQTLSPQFAKSTEKLSQSPGLSPLSSSTEEIVLKETVNLIKGITIDLLGAALNALTQPSSPTPNATSPKSNNAPASDPVETAPPGNTVSSTNLVEGSQSSPPRKNESLSSFLQRELKPNGEGNFHEEQLQYGIAAFMLNEKSSELYQQYKTAYSEYKKNAGSTGNFEDGVKSALKSLVSSKKLSKTEAEDINGKSFRAAQLDNDTKALFDDKGGKGDNTISVMSAKEAAEKVDRAYGRIRRGETSAPSRSLDAPSNTKSVATLARSASAPASGFLWKPVSESDGKLAILIPSNISEEVESVSVYKVDSSGNRSLVEKGRASGNTEGRAVFRFNQAGAQYPDGAIVEIKLKNGEVVSETIKETSSRVEG